MFQLIIIIDDVKAAILNETRGKAFTAKSKLFLLLLKVTVIRNWIVYKVQLFHGQKKLNNVLAKQYRPLKSKTPSFASFILFQNTYNENALLII